MFQKLEDVEKNENINNTIDEIHSRYGNNSILKATSLLKNSTIKERNNKINL